MEDHKRILIYFDKEMEEQAAELAEYTGGELTDHLPDDERLYLKLDKKGLSLNKGTLSMEGDLTQMLPRLRQSNLEHEILLKAARIKNSEGPLTAIDATAGMGEDSVLLAAAGYQVQLFEYDPVIAALLADGLRRAQAVPELEKIVGRMKLSCTDSIRAMREYQERPDVIYLDPMFPAREKSGLIKKKFQLLQQLERPCGDEAQLFDAAAGLAPKKLVVKRPQKGPHLAGRKPDYTVPGKAIRYDIYINLK